MSPSVTILGPDGVPLAQPSYAPMASAHDAGSLSIPEFHSWNPFPGSADAEYLPERETIVARSRDLSRNNGLAAGAVQTEIDNVVGTGLRLVPTPDYVALGRDKKWARDWAKTARSRFRLWAGSARCDAARSLNFHGLTRQVLRGGFLNGEALALPLWLADRGINGLALQVIEADRLCNPYNRLDTETMRGGVEDDQYGGPVAYWIRKSHPGDLLMTQILGGEWERIPAETAWGRKRVIHVHDKERSGQTRGKPALTALMRPFKTLSHYTTNELQAAVANAAVAAFLETPLNPEEAGELFGLKDQTGRAQYLNEIAGYRLKLKGGTIPVLPVGTRLSPFMPSRPAQAFAPFVDAMLRQIAAGLNIPYELLLKDFSKTNYSSARAALLEAWRFFLGRRQWLATYWAQPVYELWLEGEIAAGTIEGEGFYENREAWTAARWGGPGRGWIDPTKEAQAALMRMDALVSTLEIECAEQGLDWEEVLEQRAIEFATMRELGLPEPSWAVIKEGRPGATDDENREAQREDDREQQEEPQR